MSAFIPNPGFAEEFRDEPDTREGLRESAEAIKAHADPIVRSIGAPWMGRRGEHETIVVFDDANGVYVVNTDHAGHLMEFGSQNNPPHAPLRRAARAAGAEVVETDF